MKKARTNIVIFESPTSSQEKLIRSYLRKKFDIYVIEPFVGYHHRSQRNHLGQRIPHFPLPLSPGIEALIEDGSVRMFSAAEFSARRHIQKSAEMAVEYVERIFPEYRLRIRWLIDAAINRFDTVTIEDAFKKDLCEQLGSYFSLDLIFEQINSLLGGKKFLFLTNADLGQYIFIRELVQMSCIVTSQHNAILNKNIYLQDFFRNSWIMMVVLTRLIAGTFVSLFVGRLKHSQFATRSSFPYAVNLSAPSRQLRGTQRGPFFLADNNAIAQKDILLVSAGRLSSEHIHKCRELTPNVLFLTKARFSLLDIVTIISIALLQRPGRNVRELVLYVGLLRELLKWTHALTLVRFNHFITHSDFDPTHIARSIIFSRKGIQTWYFADSANSGYNYDIGDGCKCRHPFWAFLRYDHLVTWCQAMSNYHMSHPTAIDRVHVVGCLWASHISSSIKTKAITEIVGKDFDRDSFLIAAFPSTYSVKGSTSYEEGIDFLNHLIRLCDEVPGISLVVKDKKSDQMHLLLEPRLGQLYLDQCKTIDNHPKMRYLTNETDSSKLIAAADFSISFPFTSTTFEALSARKNAVWHDPLGYYKNSPYGMHPFLTTHSYEELKSLVVRLRDGIGIQPELARQSNPELFDPWQDGQAIDRFRALLAENIS